MQAAADPALDAPDIEACLDKARVAGVWEASTAYSYGDKVVPASPKGRYYRCVTPGTSGATEPTFPAYDYGQVTDGDCVWEEAGAFSSLYDLRRACYEAWNMKAAKAVNKDQYLQDSRGQASSYLYLNCIRERDKYRPAGVA